MARSKDKSPAATDSPKVKPSYSRPSQLGDAPAEFYNWFKEADKDRDGVLSGQEAVAFFVRSRLPQPQLAKIWALSDKNRRGVLDLEDFVTSMRLISLAQSGQPLAADSLASVDKAELKLPQLVGINIAGEVDESLMKPSAAKSKRTMGVQQRIPAMSLKQVNSLQDGLSKLYFKYLKPLEEKYQFNVFHSPLMRAQDFMAKPAVMMLGQYSVGKTSFIKYLLGDEYPSAVIGPEPTTDRFVVVSHAHVRKTTPGNALAVSADRPFNGLQKFGQQFLNKFAGAELPSPLLDSIDMIDTPGVLSGEKQRLDRGYDFPDVVRWFAERCDLILLIFDPYKLDISDEFKRVMHKLSGFDEKVRIVLNKADQVDSQHLMRVYGALMWSLSRIFKAPEVPRVYTSNFQEGEFVHKEFEALMNRERTKMMDDLYEIPRSNVARQVSEFVKRVRALKIHCMICSSLSAEMPSMFGKDSKKAKLIARLEETFLKVQQKHDLAVGDFPPLEAFREQLRATSDLARFPKLTSDKVKIMDEILELEIPALLQRFGNPFA